MHLVVVQERSSLLVRLDNMYISPEADFFAKDTRNSNNQSSEEQSRHDGKSKDPLEFNALQNELANTEGRRQNAECKTDSVVLLKM